MKLQLTKKAIAAIDLIRRTKKTNLSEYAEEVDLSELLKKFDLPDHSIYETKNNLTTKLLHYMEGSDTFALKSSVGLTETDIKALQAKENSFSKKTVTDEPTADLDEAEDDTGKVKSKEANLQATVNANKIPVDSEIVKFNTAIASSKTNIASNKAEITKVKAGTSSTITPDLIKFLHASIGIGIGFGKGAFEVEKWISSGS